MLSKQLPSHEIHGPAGQSLTIDLTQDRVTIGRFREFNDVGLEPDPQQLVTRKVHCALERDAESWWVVDNGSINRTLLLHNQVIEIVNGRVPIVDGDIIRILGMLIEEGEPIYWELTFRDPLRTQRADVLPYSMYIEYDWIQAKLFRVEGASRGEVRSVRPQEHKLIRYMLQRNRSNNDIPAMCTYDELIVAIWDEDTSQTETEVTHLIWELRQKLEPNPKTPKFLQTVRGLGYRLVTRP